MADLNFAQSADPVAVVNETSGNELVINSDGTLPVQDYSQFETDQGRGCLIIQEVTVSGNGTETPITLIKNPNGSGKKFKLIQLVVSLTNTVGAQVIIKVYANPTITTDGTTLTVRPQRIGSGDTFIATVFSSPTVSANGILYDSLIVPSGANGVGTSSSPSSGLLQVYANNNLLITATPDGTNRGIILIARWIEE